jgi:hypothetical protein
VSAVVGLECGPCQLYEWTVYGTKVLIGVNHDEQTARYRAWESGVLTRDASMPIEDALTICWYAAASAADLEGAL